MNEIKVLTTNSRGEYFFVIWRGSDDKYNAGIYDNTGSIIDHNSGPLQKMKSWAADMLIVWNEENEE